MGITVFEPCFDLGCSGVARKRSAEYASFRMDAGGQGEEKGRILCFLDPCGVPCDVNNEGYERASARTSDPAD